jgi:hypothetical protein
MNTNPDELSQNFHLIRDEIEQIKRLESELICRKKILNTSIEAFVREALHVLPCEAWLDCGNGLFVYIEHPDNWNDENALKNIQFIQPTTIKREVDLWVADQEALEAE